MKKSMFKNYTAKKSSNIIEYYEGKLGVLDEKQAKENQRIEAKKQELEDYLDELSNKIAQAKKQKSLKEQELMDLQQSKLEALDELMQAQETEETSKIQEVNKKIDNLEERIKYVKRDLETAELKTDTTKPYVFGAKDRKRLAQLLQEYDALKKNKEIATEKFSIGAEMVKLGEELKRLGDRVSAINDPTTTGYSGKQSPAEDIFKRSSFFKEITNSEHHNFFNGYFGEGKALETLLTLPKDKSFAEYTDTLIQEKKEKEEARNNKPFMTQRGFH